MSYNNLFKSYHAEELRFFFRVIHIVSKSVFFFSFENSALSTAVPETLYAAFQDEVQDKLNVTEFMSGWIAQPGYPVLNVNVSSDRKTVVISQRKFLQNNADHEDKTLWHIPITYASDKKNIEFNETKAKTFIGVDSLKIVLVEDIEWIVFNVQQTGWCINVEFKYFDLISLLTL